tara:strand:- start:153 stop:440 length:288 start_codon:yes stop_codon:yes gene_type:complete
METITLEKSEDIAKIIDDLGGSIATATFIKKNGDTRVMNFRKGVKEYANGGKLAFNPKEKGLIQVFDMKIKEYRLINRNTIVKLKCKGMVYSVEK